MKPMVTPWENHDSMKVASFLIFSNVLTQATRAQRDVARFMK